MGFRPGNVSRLPGIQAWLALPRAHEETAPAFEHFPAAKMPRMEQAKADCRAGRFATIPGDDEFIPLPEK